MAWNGRTGWSGASTAWRPKSHGCTTSSGAWSGRHQAGAGPWHGPRAVGATPTTLRGRPARLADVGVQVVDDQDGAALGRSSMTSRVSGVKRAASRDSRERAVVLSTQTLIGSPESASRVWWLRRLPTPSSSLLRRPSRGSRLSQPDSSSGSRPSHAPKCSTTHFRFSSLLP